MSIKLISKFITFFISLCVVLSFIACVGSTDSGAQKKQTIKDKVEEVEGSTSKAKLVENEVVEETKSFDPEKIAKAKEMIASVSEEDIASLDAMKIFRKNCAICHGRKGNMKINGAKDLRISTLTMEERVANIYFGQGLMTPFKGVMTEEEIVATAEYIEGFR